MYLLDLVKFKVHSNCKISHGYNDYNQGDSQGYTVKDWEMRKSINYVNNT